MLIVFMAGFVGLFTFGGVSAAAAYPAPPVVININVVVNVNITIINVGGSVIFFGTGFNGAPVPGQGHGDADPPERECKKHEKHCERHEPVDVKVAYRPPSGLRSSPALSELAAVKQFTVSPDSAGDFSSAVLLTEVGTATLTATGSISGDTASQTVQVLAADAKIPAGTKGSNNTIGSGGSGADSGIGSSSDLASGGASMVGPIAIGAAALFAGLALLYVGTRGVVRRRRSWPTGSA